MEDVCRKNRNKCGVSLWNLTKTTHALRTTAARSICSYTEGIGSGAVCARNNTAAPLPMRKKEYFGNDSSQILIHVF